MFIYIHISISPAMFPLTFSHSLHCGNSNTTSRVLRALFVPTKSLFLSLLSLPKSFRQAEMHWRNRARVPMWKNQERKGYRFILQTLLSLLLLFVFFFFLRYFHFGLQRNQKRNVSNRKFAANRKKKEKNKKLFFLVVVSQLIISPLG